MTRSYDLEDDSVVVVIGSGAGGGTLSNELAQSGIDVVCLEAGPRIEVGEFRNDEVLMDEKLTWRDPREGSGDVSRDNPLFVCKTVGGTTVHWTALALRPTEQELEPLSTYGSTPEADLVDWPIPYDELSHYFGLAERKMGVAGTNGMPSHEGSNNYQVLNVGAMKLGYPYTPPANVAINSVPYDGRPACRQSGFCRSGCIYSAKWSTLYTEIPKAEKTGHFELRPESMVLKIEQGENGRVSSVVYRDREGRTLRQKARAVAVAGNAIETARLLLTSASSRSPDGLGNQNGLVGRYYMRHAFSFVIARMPGRVNMYKGIVQMGSLDHQAHHDPSRGFASGYHLENISLSPARLTRFITPHEGWGEGYAAAMEDYENTAAALMCGEDFPESTNRVTLHESRTDQNGMPIAKVHYVRSDNSWAMIEHGVGFMNDIFGAVGATKTYRSPRDNPSIGPATHNLGTARMGSTEEQGVCDPFGNVFGVPNLFISDGSQFPTSMTANPTLTIVALAIRQAGHIGKQMVAKAI